MTAQRWANAHERTRNALDEGFDLGDFDHAELAIGSLPPATLRHRVGD